jgi:hypothetical protein
MKTKVPVLEGDELRPLHQSNAHREDARSNVTLGKNLTDKVRVIALETVRVLAVILCWAVALPVVLVGFVGVILWEKAEKMAGTIVTRSKLTSRCVDPEVEIDPAAQI